MNATQFAHTKAKMKEALLHGMTAEEFIKQHLQASYSAYAYQVGHTEGKVRRGEHHSVPQCRQGA